MWTMDSALDSGVPFPSIKMSALSRTFADRISLVPHSLASRLSFRFRPPFALTSAHPPGLVQPVQFLTPRHDSHYPLVSSQNPSPPALISVRRFRAERPTSCPTTI